MAKSGTVNRPLTEKNINLEKSSRFEKTLGLFSENDQKFLINSSPEEFRDFLGKKGFPAEDLLEARDAWISQGGVVSEPAPQDQEKQNDDKDQHQRHQADHPTEKQIRDGKIKDLEGKAEKGIATESETKELNNLRQEGRVEELEQKVKEGKISDAEREELENIKQKKASATKSETTTEKPNVNPGEKLWGEGTGYSEPAPKATITSTRKSITQRVKNFGRPTSPASENASSLWGQGASYSRPMPKLDTTREAFFQRTPSFRSLGGRMQNETISSVNRTARAAKNIRQLAGAASKAAKASRAVSALASIITFLVSNPVGWVIDIIIVCLIVIFLFFILFSGNQTTSDASPTSCDTGICYYIDGPPQVNNGDDICYQITLIYEPTKATTTVDKIAVYDTYPYPDTSFTDASGTFTHTASINDVAWYLSQNTSTTPTDPLKGGGTCNAPPPSVSPSAGQNAYYFKIKLTPSVVDKAIVNTIGIRVQ